jgi:hypothetical protein
MHVTYKARSVDKNSCKDHKCRLYLSVLPDMGSQKVTDYAGTISFAQIMENLHQMEAL